MNVNYELDIPQRTIVGAGSLARIGDEVKRLGWSGVLVVSDPYHLDKGTVSEVGKYIAAAGAGVSDYTGVTGEPDVDMVDLGLEQLKQDGCDGIVAIGGGSVIDTAKAISVMATNEGTVQQFMGVDNVPDPGIGVIAIPTTSGTGSEATKVVVITDSQTQVKMTGRSCAFLPAGAILDHTLTMSMSPTLTAEVGIDALTHAIEAYVSRLSNQFTDVLAISAIDLVWSAIRRAVRDGTDEQAREQMLMGSYRAGIAFSNSSVGLVHSMSEPIGACFHVPHGLSNAMLLPAATKLSYEGALSRYATIARIMKLAEKKAGDDECVRMLVEVLYELNREFGIATPKAFGIAPEEYERQVEKMAIDAFNAGSTANNPVQPSMEQIVTTYREIFE